MKNEFLKNNNNTILSIKISNIYYLYLLKDTLLIFFEKENNEI